MSMGMGMGMGIARGVRTCQLRSGGPSGDGDPGYPSELAPAGVEIIEIALFFSTSRYALLLMSVYSKPCDLISLAGPETIDFP
jgi:hypothetical protein